MCYIQLSLYGIPAVVVHGNSLTNEEWSSWQTPVYIIDGWRWKSRRCARVQEKGLDETMPAEVKLPAQQKAMETYEQLNLFGESEV